MSDQNEENATNLDKKNLIPKPKNILMDIYGVITPWNFREVLRNYTRDNIQKFLNRKFSDKLVVYIINKLREQAAIENRAGIQIPLIEEPNKSMENIINSVVTNILWQMDNKHNTSQIQLDTLYQLIWTDAYTSESLKVDIFPDVQDMLKHWCFHQLIKIYSYASGSREGQKLFLSSTAEGDISPLFANYINSSGGYKYDPNKFRVVVAALREPNPQSLLYLTDEPRKARAAIEVDVSAVVILRPGNTTYTEKELKGLITVESLDQIKFEVESGESWPCC